MIHDIGGAALCLMHGMKLATVRLRFPGVVVREDHDHYKVIEKGKSGPKVLIVEKYLREKAQTYFAGLPGEVAL